MDGRNSRLGVFDPDALVRGEAHAVGTGQKDVGRRLAVRDRARVGDKIELVGNTKQSHDVTGVAARRRKADFQPGGAQLGEQAGDAREEIGGRIIGQPRPIERILFRQHRVERPGVDRGAGLIKDQPQRPRAVNPFQSLVHRTIESKAICVGERLPRLIMILGGVGQHAIEVEDRTLHRRPRQRRGGRADAQRAPMIENVERRPRQQTIGAAHSVDRKLDHAAAPLQAEAVALPGRRKRRSESRHPPVEPQSAPSLRQHQPASRQRGHVQAVRGVAVTIFQIDESAFAHEIERRRLFAEPCRADRERHRRERRIMRRDAAIIVEVAPLPRHRHRHEVHRHRLDDIALLRHLMPEQDHRMISHQQRSVVTARFQPGQFGAPQKGVVLRIDPDPCTLR
eukprot:Opistho-1_new@72114